MFTQELEVSVAYNFDGYIENEGVLKP